MKKTFELLKQEFISSPLKTEQYKVFHRTFKREFTKALKEKGCSNIKIGKPNHFDVSGFFQAPGGQMWYFNISDLRWSKDQMLIRTARNATDYTGGVNQYVSLTNEEILFDELSNIVLNW